MQQKCMWILPVGPESGILSCLSPSSSSELDATTPRFTAALLVDLARLDFALGSGR